MLRVQEIDKTIRGKADIPASFPRCKGNGGEIILPVMTDAAGELYNVSEAKTLQNCPHIIPLCLSKAFSASSEKNAQGVGWVGMQRLTGFTINRALKRHG